MTDKYAVERHPNKQPPEQKLTGLNWDQLVEIIFKNTVWIAKRIRYDNVGVSKGTEQISGSDMLRLWKEVERKIEYALDEQGSPMAVYDGRKEPRTK